MIRLLTFTFLGIFIAGMVTHQFGVAILALVSFCVFMYFLELHDLRLAAQAKQHEQDITPPDSESALEPHSSEAGRTHL